MTDAEIDALARELLTYVVHKISSWDAEFFHEVLRLPDGELMPVYAATSEEQIGAVLCEFVPLPIIKTAIVESERILDEFLQSLESQPLSEHNLRMIKETYAETRARTVKLMAQNATLHLIAFFHVRLADLLGEAIEDCKVIGESYLTSTFAIALDSYSPEPVVVDARKGIEDAAERVAAKKRKFLIDGIKDLPFVTTYKGRGAPKKSQYARETAREEYVLKVEAAYRTLRSKKGQPPTKTSVAKELGEGGVSPKTGIDSSLAAFRNKLKRLAIDYDEITSKVEAELNNNSD